MLFSRRKQDFELSNRKKGDRPDEIVSFKIGYHLTIIKLFALSPGFNENITKPNSLLITKGNITKFIEYLPMDLVSK